MIRMDLRPVLAGLIFIFWMASCGNMAENQSDQNSFDLVGLVDSQVILLTNNNYQIRKISRLGSSDESTQFVPDSAGWARELNIIRTADISKPGLRSYYTIETYDSLEFNIDHYTLLDSGNSTTIYQKIYWEKASGQLLKIQALQNVNNPIYDSERYIEIIFNKEDRENLIIDSIIVEGFQKMILSDTTLYRSISKILP
jgi:hypothetical protein